MDARTHPDLGVCPKCKKEKPLTKHHVFPQRHFGKNNKLGIFKLCRCCHDNLERLIPWEVMPREFYPAIIKTFINHME